MRRCGGVFLCAKIGANSDTKLMRGVDVEKFFREILTRIQHATTWWRRRFLH